MIKIYHNPRCSKSRLGLAAVEDSGKEYIVIKYLEEDHLFTTDELQEVITKLEITPIDLVRKNEAIWKQNYKGKQLSDEEIVTAMVTHPKLIERPIVIDKKKGVIGRPTELITEFLNKS